MGNLHRFNALHSDNASRFFGPITLAQRRGETVNFGLQYGVTLKPQQLHIATTEFGKKLCAGSYSKCMEHLEKVAVKGSLYKVYRCEKKKAVLVTLSSH